MAARRLTETEITVILGSLSEEQKGRALAFLSGYAEEAFQKALRLIGRGD
jgi:hypothetical protein